MKSKVCSKCDEEKFLDEYYSDKRAKDGKRSCCKICHNLKQRSEEGKTKRRLEYDPESRRESYLKHRNKALEQSKKYYLTTRDKKLAYGKWHYRANKSKYLGYTRSRQTRLLQRTPDWLTKGQLDEIKDFYWLAKDLEAVSGETYHVDHIVPLQGENVCGLHVPWNLQILPADINLSKGNRYANPA